MITAKEAKAKAEAARKESDTETAAAADSYLEEIASSIEEAISRGSMSWQIDTTSVDAKTARLAAEKLREAGYDVRDSLDSLFIDWHAA